MVSTSPQPNSNDDRNSQSIKPNTSLTVEEMFSAVVETTFSGELGVVETDITGYVSGLFTKFFRSDQGFMRDVRGRAINDVPSQMEEAQHCVGEAARERFTLIGDRVLFYMGFYKGGLSKELGAHVSSKVADSLNIARERHFNYGQEAYARASEIDSEQNPSSELLIALKERFKLITYGIEEVYRAWNQIELEGAEHQGILIIPTPSRPGR